MISANGRTSTAELTGDREVNIGGLCTNCAHLNTCTYANPVNDTWFCEEYLLEQSARSTPRNDELKVLSKSNPQAGLCGNCELSDDCTFPKLPGGVWFCSEYR